MPSFSAAAPIRSRWCSSPSARRRSTSCGCGIAHHVSAIAIRAQAGLAVAPQRPEAASEALATIAEEASRTLAEMRAMVRVLRAGDAPDLAPSPQVSDLERLAAPVGDGPAVEVEITDDLLDVLPAVSAALYRLAQDSITNARRHARNATRIVVGVTADPRAVHLVVRDDGEPVPPRRAEVTGFGVRGMIERAALLGGTCVAGPAPIAAGRSPSSCRGEDRAHDSCPAAGVATA